MAPQDAADHLIGKMREHGLAGRGAMRAEAAAQGAQDALGARRLSEIKAKHLSAIEEAEVDTLSGLVGEPFQLRADALMQVEAADGSAT
jgi:hypothetical protein